MVLDQLAPVTQTLGKLAEEGATLFDHAVGRASTAPSSWGTNPLNSSLAYFIVEVVIVIVLSKTLSWILSKIKQPSVIAEVITGIILGPTVMGRVPNFTAKIFPPAQLVVFSSYADIGLVLFMNLVGLELDFVMMAQEWKSTAIISVTGIALPMVVSVGSSYAVWETIDKNYPSAHKKEFGTYVLFMAVAMSITAFPVLARIVKEKALMKTRIGTTALAVAAWDDVTAWILLALSISLIGTGAKYDALWTFLSLIGFAVLMLFPVRIFLRWWLTKKNGEMREFTIYYFAAYIVGMFSCAWITQYFGLHSIFGAFIWGLVIPRERKYSEKIAEKFEDFTTTFFLPLYFTTSGLKTQLGLLNDFNTWGLLLLIVSIAISTKIAGGTFAAKISGLTWRESFTLGVLMNTKGLVELIVLNIGLDAGLISSTTFSMMVVMALVTTFLTSPFVHYLYPYHRIVEFANQTPGKTNMLVAIRNKQSVPGITGLLSLISKSRPKKYRVTFARSRYTHETPNNLIGTEDEVLADASNSASILGMHVRTVEMPHLHSNDNSELVSQMVTLTNAKNTNFLFMIWRPDPSELVTDSSSERMSFDTNSTGRGTRGVDMESFVAVDDEHNVDMQKIPLGGTLVRRVVTHKRFKSNMCVLLDRGLQSSETNIIFLYSGTEHDAIAARLVKAMLHNPAVNVEIVVALAKPDALPLKKNKGKSAATSAASAAIAASAAEDPTLNTSGEIDSNTPTREKLLAKDPILNAFFNVPRAGTVSLSIIYRTRLNHALAHHITESNAGLVVTGTDLNWQLASKEGIIRHRIVTNTPQSYLFVAKCVGKNGGRIELPDDDDDDADLDASSEHAENAVLLENASKPNNLNTSADKDQIIEEPIAEASSAEASSEAQSSTTTSSSS